MSQIVLLLTALLALAPASVPETSGAAAQPIPRVRPYDARTAALLLQGMERSRTLRALVDRLEDLDVIVYIEMQPAMRDLAGRLTWLTRGASFRFVRISLNPELANDVLIATLGHELQHALEVALAPSIVDASTLGAFYKEQGISTPGQQNGWDTIAARLVGEDVRREIAGMRTSRVAESIQPFAAGDWHDMYRRARSMLPP